MADQTPAIPVTVPLVDPTGAIEEVDPSEVKDNLAYGYKIPDTKQLVDYKAGLERIAKYSAPGEMAKTAAEGVAKGLTAGLSTLAETELGISTPEEIKARAEINPTIHGVAELGGMVAPAVLTAGGSLAEQAGVQGAKAAAKGAAELSIPSLITRAGARVGELVIGEAASAGIARKALAGAASLGTEAALWSAGSSISEAALDKDFTAEAALMNGGISALLGGVLGGAVGAGGGVVSKLLGSKGKSSVSEWITDELKDFEGTRALKAAGGIQSDIARMEKTYKPEGVRQLGREMMDARTELDGKSIIEAGDNYHSILDKSEKVRSVVGDKMGKFLDTADEELTRVRASGAKYPDYLSFNKIVEDSEDKIIGSKKLQSVSNRDEALQFHKMLLDWEDNFAQKAGIGTINGTKGFLRDTEGRILDPVTRKIADIPITFSDLHDLRMETSDLIWKNTGDLKTAKVVDAYRDFRSILTDKLNNINDMIPVLDMTALGEWRQLNRSYEVASKSFDLANRGIRREAGNNMFGLTSQIIGSAAGTTLGLTHGSMAGAIGGGLLGAGAELVKNRASSVLGPAARWARALIDSGVVKEGVKDALANKTSAILSAGNKIPISTSNATHMVLSAAETRNLAIASKIGSGVKDIFVVGNNPLIPAVVSKEAQSINAESHAKIIDALQKAQNIDMQQNRIEQHINDLVPHAPGIAATIAAKGTAAIGFLAGQPLQHQSKGPLAPAYITSREEITKLNTIMETIKNPLSILEASKSGTLTRDQVMAVQTIYPSVFKKIQDSVLEEIVKHKLDEIPYRTRQSLSILMGQDLDGTQSLYPSAQGIYKKWAQEQKAQEKSIKNSSDRSKNIQTAAQKAENRKG